LYNILFRTFCALKKNQPKNLKAEASRDQQQIAETQSRNKFIFDPILQSGIISSFRAENQED
jgi:hypothetical protein